MSDKIKMRRGDLADIPTLDDGEWGLAEDVDSVYIGNDSSNVYVNPVKVTGDAFEIDGYLLPVSDNVYGLGNDDKRWSSLSVGPGSIHLISDALDPAGEKTWTIAIDASGDLIFLDKSVGVPAFSVSSSSSAMLLADGTVTDPAYSFIDDTNTGLYRSGTDTLGFVTAGSEALTINAAGLVGIGVTPAAEQLELGGAVLLGDAAGTVNGTVKWTGTDFEGRKGGSWVTLTDEIITTKVDQHWVDSSEQRQDLRDAADGYGLDRAENDQRWIDSSQQRQDLRDAADGYGLDRAENDQRWTDSSQQRQDLRDAADGYGLDRAENDQRWVDSTAQRQDLRDAADGYVTAVGVPLDSQIGVWTGADTLEGTSSLVFDSTGMGIGTSSPSNLLHVNSVGTASEDLLMLESDTVTNGNYVGIQFKSAFSATESPMAAIRATIDSGDDRGLGFWTTTDRATLVEQMHINHAGNVGIGTTSPGSKLEVSDSGTIEVNIHSTTSGGVAALELGAGGTGNRLAYMDFVGDATYTDYGLRLIRGNSGANASSTIFHRGTGAMVLDVSDAGSMVFKTTALERMRVIADGKVGIGTTSPATLLHVFADNELADADDSETLIARYQDSVNVHASTNNFNIKTRRFALGASTWFNSGIRLEASISEDSGAQSWIEFRHYTAASSNGIVFGEGSGDANTWMTMKDGLVGIGEEVPLGNLHIKASDAGAIAPSTNADELVLENSGSCGLSIYSGNSNTGNIMFGDVDLDGAGRIVYNHSGDLMSFYTANTERARIDSNGDFGIGTTDPLSLLHLRQAASGADVSGAEVAMEIESDADTFIQFRTPSNKAPGILFGDVESAVTGQIRYVHSSDSMAFYTAATARMTISTDGDIGIGVAPTASRRFYVVGDDVSGYAARFWNEGDNINRFGIEIFAGEDTPSGTNKFIQFGDGGGVDAGGIHRVGAATPVFFAPSDERLKADIAPTQIMGLETINGLQLREFKKVKNSLDQKPNNDVPLTKIGWIAQEVEKVYPEMVNEYDGVKNVSEGCLVPVLVKAVQELTDKLNEATARIEALEQN